jgi:hypothetical protein
VTGEADVTQFAGELRFQESGMGALLVEDAVWVFVAEDFVVLHEVDAVDAQPT